MGGHPSLWTGFPLQLTGPRRLKSFSKIRRLVWIKSVTITPLPGRELENCHAVVKHFGRMEELFVNGGNDGVDIPDVLLVNLLREQVSKNRLVRFGVKMHYGILVAQYGTPILWKAVLLPPMHLSRKLYLLRKTVLCASMVCPELI